MLARSAPASTVVPPLWVLAPLIPLVPIVALLSMFWLFLFIAWIWLVISVFIDIFRSDDLCGWGKAGWTIVVLFLPLIGVLIYVIARGDKMQERRVNDAVAQRQATDEYIRFLNIKPRVRREAVYAAGIVTNLQLAQEQANRNEVAVNQTITDRPHGIRYLANQSAHEILDGHRR